MPFVNVCGPSRRNSRVVPSLMAAGASLTEKIELVKPRIMTMLAGIDATIGQLDHAETPEQFEQSFQMGVFQAFGGMMELAQAMEQDVE